jgi:hypothetical protein
MRFDKGHARFYSYCSANTGILIGVLFSSSGQIGFLGVIVQQGVKHIKEERRKKK